MTGERLKRALETLLAEPSKRLGTGSSTLLVAYRIRDRPTMPSSAPCHILMTAYDAEHPTHQLLTDTGLPVAKVASMVGYEGTSNFHRLFRERFGTSPARVRAGRGTGDAAMMETRTHGDHVREASDDRG